MQPKRRHAGAVQGRLTFSLRTFASAARVIDGVDFRPRECAIVNAQFIKEPGEETLPLVLLGNGQRGVEGAIGGQGRADLEILRLHAPVVGEGRGEWALKYAAAKEETVNEGITR